MGKKSQKNKGDWELGKARILEKLWERGDVNWEDLVTWKPWWELPEQRQSGCVSVSSPIGYNKLLIKENLEESLLEKVQVR